MAMAQGLTKEQVLHIMDNVDTTPHVDEPTRGLLRLAEKVTRHAYKVAPGDMDGLRAVGLTDGAILEALHVVGFFNYFDRMADATGTPSQGYLDSGQLVRK